MSVFASTATIIASAYLLIVFASGAVVGAIGMFVAVKWRKL